MDNIIEIIELDGNFDILHIFAFMALANIWIRSPIKRVVCKLTMEFIAINEIGGLPLISDWCRIVIYLNFFD